MAVIFNVVPAANQRASSVRRPAGLGFGGLRVRFTIHAVEQLDSMDLGAGQRSDIARPSNVSTANMSSVLNTHARALRHDRARSVSYGEFDALLERARRTRGSGRRA